MSSNISEKRKRGRPRGFDERDALDAAMRTFWSHGFDGASVDLLSRAMRVPRSSLYQQYADKEGLFLAVVAHYAETQTRPAVDRLDGGGDLASDLQAFFDAVIELSTADPLTPGCLVASALSDAAGANPRMRRELSRRFAAIEERLTSRLDEAVARSELPPGTDSAALGGMLAAIARGIVLRARAGADTAVLRPIAGVAIEVIRDRTLAQ